MEKTKVLIIKELTRSSSFITGVVLGEQLGVSRAAISKSVKELKALGWPIESHLPKGYLLNGKVDILSDAVIEVLLEKVGINSTVHCFETIGSTNSWAKENLESLHHFDLVTAEEQTAGRGRFNRQFYSPIKTGIYTSFIIEKDLSTKHNYTCAAAVAVMRTIQRLTGKSVKIKWVNDIFLENKKVCGILTEAIFDLESQTLQKVIIGIGMNLSTRDFPKELETIAESIDVNFYEKNSRNEWIATLTEELYHILTNETLSTWMQEYRNNSLVMKKYVSLQKGEKIVTGMVIDIDDQGVLTLLDDTAQLHHFNSGEVTLSLKIEKE